MFFKRLYHEKNMYIFIGSINSIRCNAKALHATPKTQEDMVKAQAKAEEIVKDFIALMDGIPEDRMYAEIKPANDIAKKFFFTNFIFVIFKNCYIFIFKSNWTNYF